MKYTRPNKFSWWLLIPYAIGIHLINNANRAGELSDKSQGLATAFLLVVLIGFNALLQGSSLRSLSPKGSVPGVGNIEFEDEREEIMFYKAGKNAYVALSYAICLIGVGSLILSPYSNGSELFTKTMIIPSLALLIFGSLVYNISLKRSGVEKN
jgi:hypothetical protein